MTAPLPYTDAWLGNLGRLFAGGRGREGSNRAASVTFACRQSSSAIAFRIYCTQYGGMIPDSESREKRTSSADQARAADILSVA